MTELDRTWAQTQVEAMAEGSLAPAAERRMRALMQADADLRRQVELARRLQRDLGKLSRGRVPGGLPLRLWRIPAADRAWRADLIPAMVLASVAAVVIGISFWLGESGPSADERAQQLALRDFAIAMSYLQKGVLVASSQVNTAVSSGMTNAMVISRDAADMEPVESEKGVQDDDD